jgi:predicted esterase
MPDRQTLRSLALFLVVAVLTSSSARAQPQADADLTAFWAGTTVAARRDAGARAAATGATFEAALAALARGPQRAPARSGRIVRQHDVDGVEHPYLLLVPDNYDPARAYPVRFYLHGGVSRGDIPANGGWWRDTDRLRDDDSIAVIPASWGASMWWQRSQLANVNGILAALRQSYNIDDNRVYALGISDGGTGAWYFAFLDPTPWAGFVPLIGHPAVLASPSVGAQGQMHIANLRNRPFLAINGGLDRLYPTRSVLPYVELFRDAGVDVEHVNRADAGHTVSWWPEEASRIESFLQQHVRDPLPDTLSFETADPNHAGRLHWVVIEELGSTDHDADLEVYERPLNDLPGSRLIGFPHPLPSGRVEVAVDANVVTIRSRGVQRLRLLLSPRQFDFGTPVRVEVNGRIAFEGRVEASASTLLHWAAVDLDRTMPFGAEIEIDLGH